MTLNPYTMRVDTEADKLIYEMKKENVLAYLGIDNLRYRDIPVRLRSGIDSYIFNPSISDDLPMELLNRIRVELNPVPLSYQLPRIASRLTQEQIRDIIREYPESRHEVRKTTSMDIFIGSIVTDLGNNGEIDLIGEGEVPLGIVVSGYYPNRPRDNEVPFNDNEYVQVMIPSIDLTPYVIQMTEAQRLQGELLQTQSNFRNKIRETKFKISDLITLKLEDNKTNIYVNKKLFLQCKFLLLNLEEGKSYKEINSIDEAADKLSRRMESNHGIIPPETEFWGHCSNLQAWYENDYDLRIIHTNLGLPLLYELVICGDKKALMVLKEETAYRIEKVGWNAWKSNKNFHRFFTEEEKDTIPKFKACELREKIMSLRRDFNIIQDRMIYKALNNPFKKFLVKNSWKNIYREVYDKNE